MASYYYVSASLPMLTGPDQRPPVSSEEMMEVCGRLLSPKDFEGLAASSLEPEGGAALGILVPFQIWERSLRNELVRLRAAEQGLNPEDYLRETPAVLGTASTASGAMTGKSPLEAELFLDGCRWEKIDELAAGHFFDIEFLRAYRLKLQILERHMKFEEELGFAAYRELYSRVLQASGADNPTGGNKK